MRITIVHNSVAASSAPDERDVLIQVQAVAEALTKLGHEAIPLACDLDLAAVKRRIARISPDCVVNLVESLDGHGRLIDLFPSLLDTMEVAYTGSTSTSIRLTSHKIMAKEKIRAAGLPAQAWIGPYPFELCSKYTIHPPMIWPEGPWIIKSVWEHASIGLTGEGLVFAKDPEQLIKCLQIRAPKLGGACFAELYIDGREFNISLLAGPEGPVVLPPAEIIFEGYQDYKPRIVCYNAKWNEKSFEYSHTPRQFDFPPSDGPLLNELKQIAIRCWQIFDLRGYARVDFRVDRDGRPWVLEVNANPCLSPDAGFAAAVGRSGMPFVNVVESILNDALKKKEQAQAGCLDSKPPSFSISESDITFRYEPCHGDVEEIRKIITDTGFFHPYEVTVAVELVEDRLAKGPASDYFFVFLEKDGRFLGYSCYGPIPCTASSYDIYWIAVAPAFQRKGFGRVILKETERLIRKAGGTRIYMDTSESETYDTTRAFYLQCGYRFTSIMEDFYAPGDGKVVCFKPLAT